MNRTLRNSLTNVFTKLAQARILIVAVVLLAGCGRHLSGTYVGNGIPIKQFKFVSGGKVEVTTILGSTSEATYVLEDDRVKISAGGQTQILNIDKQGCLDGGDVLGKFCKQ